MKRGIAVILLLAVCLGLCACGKSDAVKAVEAQIAELTNVTYDDQEKVADVRSAYMMLPEEEQENVENLEILEQAEATIQDFEADVAAQANEIIANYDPYEAIPLLRQLPQTGRVKGCICNMALDLLKAYVLTEGVPCDLMGDPEEGGSYRAVSVELGSDRYCFVIDTAGTGYLNFKLEDESARNGMALSGFKLHMRTRTLYMGASKLYSKAEHFSKDGDFFHVSWDAFIPVGCTKEGLSDLLVDMDCSSYKYWPYELEETYMEENIHSDVDDFVEEMDECLQELGLPVTAWEVLGVKE